jgi:hypothetical protein
MNIVTGGVEAGVRGTAEKTPLKKVKAKIPHTGIELTAPGVLGFGASMAIPLPGGAKVKGVSKIAKLTKVEEIVAELTKMKGLKVAAEEIPNLAKKLVNKNTVQDVTKTITAFEKAGKKAIPQATKGVEGVTQKGIQRAVGGVPQVTEQVTPTLERGFITTVKEAPKTSEETRGLVEGLYQARNTAELQTKAANLVKDYPETAHQIVSGNKTDDTVVATAVELMNKYAREGNHTLESQIANELAPRLTEAGRTGQAASIYNSLSPEGIVRFAASEINRANQANPKLQLILKAEDAVRLREMALAASKITDETERAVAMSKVADEIGKLVPTPTINKAVAIWKAGLLTGLKTSGLNIGVNILHGTAEIVKDIPAVAVDKVASLFTGKRTKAVTTKGLFGGVKEGLRKGWLYLRTGYSERNIAAKFDYNKVHFGNSKFAKVLQGYEEGIFRMMGTEDQPFYYGAKARSLYDQAMAQAVNKKLNGLARKQFIDDFVKNPPDEALRNAVNDAEISVFQNPTALGKAAAVLGKHPVGEVIAPFRRTPTSVAMQLVNYSPAGIVKGIIDNIGKGRWDQRAFSQAMGRGITGTGLFAIGTALMDKGFIALNAPTNESERNQWELQGKKPNSIRIGDRWYNAGAFGPMGMTLLIGGYYQKALKETGSQVGALTAAVSGMGRTVVDQSFLQGLSGVLDAINDPLRYSGTYISRTLGSVVPTLISDIARGTDVAERITKEGVIQPLQSRIPGLRQMLAPQRTAFGEEVKTPGLWRTMAEFTRSTPNLSTPIINELNRLQQAGQIVSTTKVKATQTIEGKKIELTANQIAAAQKIAGSQIQQAIEETISSYDYLSADDETKKDLIDKAIRGINKTAVLSVLGIQTGDTTEPSGPSLQLFR